MATISSAGIGSGLDVNGIITQLMAIEKQPISALNTREASYQAKLSAFGSLKGAVSSLQTAARALKSAPLYSAMTAQSSNAAALSASANTAASTGTYAVQVIAKAQAQSISSSAFPSLSGDVSTIDGKIKIELGTFIPATTAPVAPATFTADPAKTAITIDVASGESSLQEIRDKINAANAGVKANIVYVGSEGYKLTLTSNDPGAKSSIKLTIMDSSGVAIPQGDLNNQDLEQLSFDPTLAANTGNEFTINVAAQDAHLKIDGLDVYRTSNTISDAITGVTMTLTETGSSTLTVGKETAAAKTAFETFIKAYNDVNTQLKAATAFDAESGKGSILTGDSGARSLQGALRSMIASARGSATGGLRNLSDLGIAMQRDGSLQFNSAKFSSAMSTSAADVAALMTTDVGSDKGLATRMTAELDNILSSGGLLATRTEGISRSIADLDSRRTTLERRLVQIEKRYRAQFTALDTLVASMQRTSQYLTQQLANLPSASAN